MQVEKPLPYIGLSLMQIVWFIVILVVGYVVVKIIILLLKKSFQRTKLPPILSEFIVRVTSILLYILVFLLALTALGYDMSSIVLGLSAILGLILGFGMQDTVTNLASGFWLALTRPFDKGDVVSVQGYTGKIVGIGIMSTHLLTFDNTSITIPNKLIWGSPIVNYTRMNIRRVDVNVGVAYGTDLDKAVKIAIDVMKKHSLVLDDPEPSVAITELADSSINLQLRAWAKTADYWTVKGEITKAIYEAYEKEGIEIPFPQMDVHLKKE
ncbi:MAG: mechanosensitive ion channel family protein [Thermoplasmata archaeon]|nr:mechanosensitive ion channel family protein [Thermoplasmata archaeon]